MRSSSSQEENLSGLTPSRLFWRSRCLTPQGRSILPGHRVHRLGETLVLTRRAGRSVGAARGWRVLLRPGRAGDSQRARSRLRDFGRGADGAVRRVGRRSCWPLVGRGDEVVVEGAPPGRAPGGPQPAARRRLPAPWISRPEDAPGLFRGCKSSARTRGRIPLVVDAEGRIVWVAGLSVAEDFRVTDRTKAVVILKRHPA